MQLEFGMQDRPLALAPLNSIPPERGLRVRLGQLDIALFRVGDTVHAIDDSCPHQGVSLSNGRLQGGIVSCPAHGLKFDVRDGCGTTQPPLRTRCHLVRVADGAVILD